MTWGKFGLLEYYSFESLDSQGVINRIFTRKGGVSPFPWASLNLGGTNGDVRENVIENRRRIFESIERPVESIYDVWQVHSNHVVCAESPRLLNQQHEKADIILTNVPEITLLMRFADCVPILLFDPIKRVVGLVHSGWMGTVNKAVEAAVSMMKSHYSCDPKKIHSVIGPSIGPDHYEIGRDVAEKARIAFDKKAEEVVFEKNGRTYFDLWRANELVLRSTGVEYVEVASICTACHTGAWYSHRAEKGLTGRFAAVIALT